MNMKKFSQQLQEKLQNRLGSECCVQLQEVQKNNGVLLTGLTIRRDEQNVSPTIYLDDFFEAYSNGYSMEKVMDDVLDIYAKGVPRECVDMDFFRHFETVKNRICYRLVDAERNAQLLCQIPHIRYLDLAICFFYAYEDQVLGKGAILIYHSHVEMWGTTIEELMALANVNTPELFPWECNSMRQVIEELMREAPIQERELFLEEVTMRILSNKSKVYGATCLIYPGLIEKVAESLNSNLFILPSSVHEVILLKDSGEESVEKLKEMIVEINRTQLETQEVLSDSLYYFDRLEGEIKNL